MNNRKIIYSSLVCLALLAAIFALVFLMDRSNDLRVVFLDVGQGDAILISQGSDQLLIDGGKDGKVLLEKMGKYVPFWDRTIETVVETHPDQDHIGGLIDLFRTYAIGTVLKTNMTSDSQTFKKLEESVSSENSRVVEAVVGDKIVFPSGAEASVLFPLGKVDSSAGSDTNSKSVVVKVSFGENCFLFTGDLPSQQEQELINSRQDINCKILKVSHHGSKYASSEEFLQAVHPTEAIISVGKNNTYGHPNQEALTRLKNIGAKIWRTDELGDIVYTCDSQNKPCVRAL